MNRLLRAGVLLFLLAAAAVKADSISATSNPFTFPSFTGVKQVKLLAPAAYFRLSGNVSKAGIVTLTWSVPIQAGRQKGVIAIYSLRGQVVKTFPVNEYKGTIQWNAAKDGVIGVTIARLVYGSIKQNLRLMICK